jgi:uncharacterized protein (TIGR02145 family)
MRFIFLQLILLGQLLVNAQSMKLIDQRNQKSYETILIGSQMWMAENLNTDRFNNGDVIYEAKTAEDWKKALDEEKPAWCYYNFDPKIGFEYGKLYNYYAVNDPRKIAPEGWKIPSIEDWRVLEKKVNSMPPFGFSTNQKLTSKTNWLQENGIDIIGFNAKPSGFMELSNSRDFGEIAFFWSENDTDIVYLRNESTPMVFESLVLTTGACHDGFEGNGFAVRCVKSIDQSTYKEDKQIDFKNKYFQGLNYIDTSYRTFQYGENIKLSKTDSTYFFPFEYSERNLPFYISDHEVTNAEYSEFVSWVRDSLARERIFKRTYVDDKSNWVTFVNYNSGKKDENGKFYLLNWDKKVDYEDPSIATIISDMFVQQRERYYESKEIDLRLLMFDYYNDSGYHYRINVYPDTNCWDREFGLRHETYQFSGHKYSNFPVVGLTYSQAEAYCYWRTKMYHRESGRKKGALYDKSLVFRLPSHEEWFRAAYGFTLNMRNDFILDVRNGYETDEEGFYQANFGEASLNSGLRIKDHRFDNPNYEYTLCNVHNYKPNFNGLYCMFGNAAEWTSSTTGTGNYMIDYVDLTRLNSFPAKDTIKMLYITDPYTDSTFLVEKGSEKQVDLIQKRLEFYKVNPDDTFEDVKRKIIAVLSINDKYADQINELNNPQIKSNNPAEKLTTNGIIDGVYEKDSPIFKRKHELKLYDIHSGDYFYIDADGPFNSFIRFEDAFYRFQQNNRSLNRAASNDLRNFNTQNKYSRCRLVKGGSWNDEPHYLLVNNAQIYYQNEASSTIGFRIAADAVGSKLNKEDSKRLNEQKKLLKKSPYK